MNKEHAYHMLVSVSIISYYVYSIQLDSCLLIKYMNLLHSVSSILILNCISPNLNLSNN